MIAVDTNILVFAHRTDSPWHEQALRTIKDLAEGDALWGLPVFCLGEFVRVVTHPRIFDPPSNLDQAIKALEGLLESPTMRVLSPQSRYPELFKKTLEVADARGNLAFDAQVAAVCLEHGVSKLLTHDRDFARFPELEILTLTNSPLQSRQERIP